MHSIVLIALSGAVITLASTRRGGSSLTRTWTSADSRARLILILGWDAQFAAKTALWVGKKKYHPFSPTHNSVMVSFDKQHD